jgi:hypothetical protein
VSINSRQQFLELQHGKSAATEQKFLGGELK